MSLLPNRFQINDEMPTLGQLVREAIQPEPCKFSDFERRDHMMHVVEKSGRFSHNVFLREQDCRQIKDVAAKNAEWLLGFIPVTYNYNQIKGAEQAASFSNQKEYQKTFIKYAEGQLRIRERLTGIAKQPGEWKDCSEDMPDLPAGEYELKWGGLVIENTDESLHRKMSFYSSPIEAFQYREIHE